MSEIPERRSAQRLVGAWVWWLSQCVFLTAIQLVPGSSVVPDYPEVPRRDCSDLRRARQKREAEVARSRATRRRWAAKLRR